MSKELVTEPGAVSNGGAISIQGRRDAVCGFLEDAVLDGLGARPVRVVEIWGFAHVGRSGAFEFHGGVVVWGLKTRSFTRSWGVFKVVA